MFGAHEETTTVQLDSCCGGEETGVAQCLNWSASDDDGLLPELPSFVKKCASLLPVLPATVQPSSLPSCSYRGDDRVEEAG